MMKRKPKSKIKKLKDKLDNVCREYNKLKYDKCVTCGKTENLQWAHLLTSASHSTRWEEKNFARQCAGCNLRHEYHPEYYTQWYLRTYGLFSYDNLVRQHHQIAMWTKSIKGIEDKIKYYQYKIDTYGTNISSTSRHTGDKHPERQDG